MKLIVGLGNIGDAYTNTYHNVGFAFLDQEVGVGDFSPNSKFFGSLNKSGDTLYLKPSTFMNASGTSVRAVARYFDISSEDIWVIHDDSDIALGQYKIHFDRGSGGHRGVQSIIQELGTKSFHRVRIGIRPERFVGKKAEVFVLRKISSDDQHTLDEIYAKIQEEVFRTR